MRANLFLLGIALALSFVLAEATLRIAAPELGRPDSRLLFTTEPPLRDELGAIRYRPHRTVRSVLLYGDQIALDTTFHSNDLGLVDHRDYLPAAPARPSYAFVGDSYAAGVEGGSAVASRTARPPRASGLRARHGRDGCARIRADAHEHVSAARLQ